MRKFICALVFIYLSIGFGCVPKHEHFSAALTVEPETIESGKPIKLIFEVSDPKGVEVKDLEIVHEKPMHLFLVSEDLSQYFHEHPERQTNGTYAVPFTFPNGGKFKIFIDFKPKGYEQTVESFDIDVSGKPVEKVELRPDKKLEKVVAGLLVKMEPNAELVKKKDLLLGFEVLDSETKQPADDLQNYLGEKAHFVIIRKGLGRFVHAHPMPGMSGDMKPTMDKMPEGTEMKDVVNPSMIIAMTNFPNSGIYKIFAQFKRNDKVITVPFVFEVK